MSQQSPKGITTRSREHQSFLNSSKAYNDNSEYPNIKKFDDYYKDKKNLENEMYLYQSPRVDEVLYQVDISKIESDKTFPPLMNQKYDLSKLSKEDLNYYMKFIDYYENQVGKDNIYLRGVHSVQAKALDLLKTCNYDINLALSKILFPVLDRIKCLDNPNRDRSLYLSSALNDLIGANTADKDEWKKYILERLNKKIGISELNVLLEKGKKMKIEIPSIVKSEERNAIQFSKKIRQLISNKNNALSDIILLFEISQTYKVQTDEFAYIGDLLSRAINWEKRVKEIKGQCVTFKTLQMLYNEGKSLPIKFEGGAFENLKMRFECAQEWHQLYSSLPKHSKTRQQGTANQYERSTLELLGKMITTAEQLNFTSTEVDNLKKNYVLLSQAEKKITAELNDDTIIKTKERLQEFVSILDNLRFTTNLYDVVESKLALLEWREKRDAFMIANNGGNNYNNNNNNNNSNIAGNGKFIKLKHFKNLIKFAEQRNISNLPEIKEFIDMYKSINSWINKVSSIFIQETNTHCQEETSSIKANDDVNNTQKVSYEELKELYQKGQQFEYRPDDCEFLLERCEEFFDFVSQCEQSIKMHNTQNDYDNLYAYLDQIKKYNIKCKEFEFIENQINNVQGWISESTEFITKFDKMQNNKLTLNELLSLDKRNNNLKLLDNFIKTNNIFYENLCNLLEKVPLFAKNSLQYERLNQIKESSEILMKEKYLDFNSLTEISKYIIKALASCVKRAQFIKMLGLYRLNSFREKSKVNKMSLSEAEEIIKEVSMLEMNAIEENEIKLKIIKTKEWIKKKRKLVSSEQIAYKDITEHVIQGEILPLDTNEVNELRDFKDKIDNGIIQCEKILNCKVSYNTIVEISNSINMKICDVFSFEVISKLRKACDNWNIIANKIINSRRLCELVIKKEDEHSDIILKENQKENENNNTQIVENEENVNVNMNKKLNQNMKIETDNINVEHSNNNIIEQFLGKKRNYKIKEQDKLTLSSYEINENYITSNNNNTNNNFLNEQYINPLISNHINNNEDHLNTQNNQIDINEDKIEEYCICRRGEKDCHCKRGEDLGNYMVMCEICKEWFHGLCIKLKKTKAESIKEYNCLCCSRRRDLDLSTQLHHSDFYEQRRFNSDRLSEFISEGDSLNVTFPQIPILTELKLKIDKWMIKYQNILTEVLDYYTKNATAYLTEILDRNLCKLYLESEGFCVEINSMNNIMLILKQSDWFKESYKCLEGKKCNEKHLKKLITSSYGLFSKEFLIGFNQLEKEYFDFISNKGRKILTEISLRYTKLSINNNSNNNNSNIMFIN